MANLKEYALVSTVAAALTYVLMCQYYRPQPTFGEGAVCSGIGFASGVAPDWIEPVLHPNHRKFCHSLMPGTLLMGCGTTICGESNHAWTQFARIMFACAITEYLTHLALDAFTRRGLSLLDA